MSKIRVLKLATGEEVIGTEANGHQMDTTGVLDPEYVGLLVLVKCRVIQVVPSGPQQMGVGLMPYSPACIDGAIAFDRSKIMAVVSHGQEIEDAYLQQTSGIQLAGAGSIVTP